MPSVRQIHAQNRITRFYEGEICGHVGLTSRMRLYIDIVTVKQMSGTIARQIFRHINKFAAAVVTLSRISLGIFMGQDTSLRFAHSCGHKVFRSNKFELPGLTTAFLKNCLCNFRILKNQFLHDTQSLMRKPLNLQSVCKRYWRSCRRNRKH